MAKTYNAEDGISYTEFFAFNRTEGGDLDNLRDSDDVVRLLQKYNGRQPRPRGWSSPPDGWFRRYWENGNLRYEWYYKDGKQDGVSKSWWPNGDLKSKRNYKDGKLHGQQKSWYEDGSPDVIHDGQLAGIRGFNNGEKEGLWIDYYPSGQVWMKKTYKSGKLTSEKYWNEDGSVGRKSCHSKAEVRLFRKINKHYGF